MATSRETGWLRWSHLDALIENRKVVFVESIVAFILFWWLLSAGLGLEDTISSPVLVVQFILEDIVAGGGEVHLVATLRRTLVAAFLTILIGNALGLVMGVSRWGEKMFQDYITVGMALPSLFAAIFAAMYFGPGEEAPVAAGIISVAPYVALLTFQGIKDVDSDIIEMSNAYDVSRRRIGKRVMLMSILPEWFAGARYAFAICWKITLLTEVIIANEGVGFVVRRLQLNFVITGVIAWTLVFAIILVVVEYGLFRPVQRRIFAWRQDSTGMF